MSNRNPGAGAILLETYNRRLPVNRAHSGPAVILFRDKISGKYTDAGGYCDPGESPAQTAARELKEESIGLFRLDIASMRTLTVEQKADNYTTFFVFVKGPPGRGIRKDKYYNNLKYLNAYAHAGTRPPSAWHETDGMTRFFIDDLITSGVMTQTGDLPTVDVYGDRQVVAGRAKAGIRMFLQKHAHSVNRPFDQLKIQDGADQKPKCSRGLGKYGTPMYNATKNQQTHCYYF